MLKSDILYKKIIGSCTKCNGVGTISLSDTEIQFCECMKFFIFFVQMLDIGVPIKFIFGYDQIEIPKSKKIFFIFKEDQHSFNLCMNLAKSRKFIIMPSTNCFRINNFSEFDGMMIYNIGLETYKDNSVILYRLIKEAIDNDIYGIFSFAISRDNLKTYYNKFIEDIVLQYE